MKLTENFWLYEFTESEIASRMGRIVVPTDEQLMNIYCLTYSNLQPLRTELSQSVFIQSGIRPLWLNTAAKGSMNSAHITGRSADFRSDGVSPERLLDLVDELNLPYDKIITGEGRNWLHIQIAKMGGNPRKQKLRVITDENGKNHYQIIN